jgi:hypothetical protein
MCTAYIPRSRKRVTVAYAGRALFLFLLTRPGPSLTNLLVNANDSPPPPRVLCSNSRTRRAGPPQSSSQVFFFFCPSPSIPMENHKGPKSSYSKSLKIVPNGNDSPHPAGITGQSRGAAWANGSVVKRWRRKDDVPIPKKRVRLHLLRPRWRQACDSPLGIAILSFGRSRKETRYSTTASRAQH